MDTEMQQFLEELQQMQHHVRAVVDTATQCHARALALNLPAPFVQQHQRLETLARLLDAANGTTLGVVTFIQTVTNAAAAGAIPADDPAALLAAVAPLLPPPAAAPSQASLGAQVEGPQAQAPQSLPAPEAQDEALMAAAAAAPQQAAAKGLDWDTELSKLEASEQAQRERDEAQQQQPTPEQRQEQPASKRLRARASGGRRRSHGS